MSITLLYALALAAAPDLSWAAQPPPALEKELQGIYVELHQAPELSLQEKNTSARLAAWLKRHGFEVTTGVGGHGVVGVLRNGAGPTVLVRTDMDALPIEEKTGLPYASKVRATDPQGRQVSVMHACGHDVHMTGWSGAAAVLAAHRDRWKGTLVMIAQPAEEIGAGARAMLEAGLFKRFPRPDFALAVHVTHDLPAGTIAGVPGFALANVDSVDIVVHGKGGHGSTPHLTVDPIVIGARIVVGLQTLISREKDPFVPAVITVGSFQAGSKHNIIPDEARLQLTVRSYADDVRRRLLSGIERIARAEAAAAGAPRPPEVKFTEALNATYNDPETTRRLTDALARTLGPAAIAQHVPVMGAEDFGEYGRAGARGVILWIGATDAQRLAAAKKAGTTVPSFHSAAFAPAPPAIKAAVQALAVGAAELLGR